MRPRRGRLNYSVLSSRLIGGASFASSLDCATRHPMLIPRREGSSHVELQQLPGISLDLTDLTGQGVSFTSLFTKHYARTLTELLLGLDQALPEPIHSLSMHVLQKTLVMAHSYGYFRGRVMPSFFFLHPRQLQLRECKIKESRPLSFSLWIPVCP